MRKNVLATILGLIAVCSVHNASAIVVTVDGSQTWNGYMNIFALNSSRGQGGYQWGSKWGLNDVKSTVGSNYITLEPNYNCFNANDAYWSNYQAGTPAGFDPVTEDPIPAVPPVLGTIGNKWMEGNTFVEYAPGLLSGSLTFTGNVDSYSLANGYNVIAFIKGLNPNTGYSMDIFQQAAIGSGSNSFSVSADLTGASGLILQYGFTVSGVNANPANSLGSVVVSAASIPEPSSVSLLMLGAVGLMGLQLRRKS
ncbi:MAG: PEP-CTERM sorting domain-containing protein [Actinobacteria bacterium]|nr:PEP-CTERM sorting domain-containing protein [Actinomycetota bacterium]